MYYVQKRAVGRINMRKNRRVLSQDDSCIYENIENGNFANFLSIKKAEKGNLSLITINYTKIWMKSRKRLCAAIKHAQMIDKEMEIGYLKSDLIVQV